MIAAAVVVFGSVVLAGVLTGVAIDRRAFRRAVRVLRHSQLGQLTAHGLRRVLHPPHVWAKAAGVLSAWLVVVIAVGWALGAISGLGPQPVALPGDQPVLTWFAARRVPWLTTTVRAVTWLGDSTVLVSAAVAVGLVWRWRRGTWRGLVVALTSYAGAALAFNALKILTGRPRPSAALALTEPAGSAYPSGHAVDAAAVYLALTLLASWAVRPRLLVGIGGVAAGAVALVAVSRLYLAVHWLSDVVAGVVIGALWTLGLVATLLTVWRGPTDRPADGE